MWFCDSFIIICMDSTETNKWCKLQKEKSHIEILLSQKVLLALAFPPSGNS